MNLITGERKYAGKVRRLKEEARAQIKYVRARRDSRQHVIAPQSPRTPPPYSMFFASKPILSNLSAFVHYRFCSTFDHLDAPRIRMTIQVLWQMVIKDGLGIGLYSHGEGLHDV